MSRSSKRSDPKVVQRGLHLTESDGTLSKRFNATTGKWETDSTKRSSRQEMAFDTLTGKLVVKRKGATVDNADSRIAIPMAAAGFFNVLWMNETVAWN